MNAAKPNNNPEEFDGRIKKKPNPGQITSIPITIIVDDVNDNVPVFRRGQVTHVVSYTSSVAENSDLGTIVTTIIADDLDKNRTITYRFVFHNNIK